MKVLIVHAHYEPQSFNTAMKDFAVQMLVGEGHEVKVSDLYAMNWNPVASSADFESRRQPDYCVYALEQRYGYEQSTLAPDILTEIEKVEWCDLLIFNFPIFWFSAPAILKGWIDRVFVSGLFYGGKRFYDRGGMTGKRAMVTFTLGGQSHMFGEDGIHGDLEVMLRPILQGALAYAGFAVLPPYAAYHVPYISQEAREEILRDYGEYLVGLDAVQPLQFPRLSDFDERLYPKRS